MSRNQILNLCVTIGMLLIAGAIVIPIFTVMRAGGQPTPLFKFLFALGAILGLVGRAFVKYDGENQRVKRLLRVEVWGAVFFVVGAAFLFYPVHSPYGSLRDALAFTLAGGIIQIFTSVMIPRALKKEEEANAAAGKNKKKK